MCLMQMHADQLRIDPSQVAGLIADQLPQWRGSEVNALPGGGTVHAIFRIGADATARFPLRPGQPDQVRALLVAEARAAGEFRVVSLFPAPDPLLIGAPGHGYPLPWSVQTWVDGDTASPTSSATSDGLARDLAELIGVLRQCDTGGRRFNGNNRGGRLLNHDAWMKECINRSAELLDRGTMQRMWSEFRELPREQPDVMSHTDLTPGNLLVTAGRLAGVLDTGGFQPADPALDLVCAWHLFDERRREVLRSTLGCGDLQWQRGRAWAFEQAMGAYWYYRDTNPAMGAMGRTTLERLIATES